MGQPELKETDLYLPRAKRIGLKPLVEKPKGKGKGKRKQEEEDEEGERESEEIRELWKLKCAEAERFVF